MKEAELKPCPFCASNDCHVRAMCRARCVTGYKVVCGKCGSSGTYVTIRDWHSTKMIAQSQAISAWNRRV